MPRGSCVRDGTMRASTLCVEFARALWQLCNRATSMLNLANVQARIFVQHPLRPLVHLLSCYSHGVFSCVGSRKLRLLEQQRDPLDLDVCEPMMTRPLPAPTTSFASMSTYHQTLRFVLPPTIVHHILSLGPSEDILIGMTGSSLQPEPLPPAGTYKTARAIGYWRSVCLVLSMLWSWLIYQAYSARTCRSEKINATFARNRLKRCGGR